MVQSSPTTEIGLLFEKLYELIKTLRSENGCPWDRKQTIKSFHHYIQEEYHELVAAINNVDKAEMVEEAGDLIFLVIFLGCMIEDEGYGSLDEILTKAHEKMTRRHPHVFGDLTVRDDKEVIENWTKIKAAEEQIQARGSVLDGIPRSLPALSRAQKLSSRAARVGFDWASLEDLAPKIEEELLEFKKAVEDKNLDKIREELGDMLFVLVNVGRLAEVNSEAALEETSDKFEKRFRYIEKTLHTQNKSWKQTNLAEMDKLWNEAKNL
ncbi:MAG: nucleoside triphosphate pyrophosphohydrolase [Desulfomonilaceae bacterium]